MPNGDDLSAEDFDQRNAPLLRVDAIVEEFAQRIGGQIIYNYHGRPNRYVQVRSPDGLKKIIMMSTIAPTRKVAGDVSSVRLFVDIVAYQDSQAGRLSWMEKTA